MKVHLLAIMACPGDGEGGGQCGGDLEYESLPQYPREGEEIERGVLRCRKCRKQYPIVDGIPRMMPNAVADSRVRKTRESFGWEWKRYPPKTRDEDRSIFLEEAQIEPEGLEEKLVLDAGCGMGRYAKVARSLGAEVVAFDLSDSIHCLIDRARGDAKMHLVQGDLLRPPFKPGVFDFAYSHGVIHHTADTRGAFDRIAPLVKLDGLLSVWVYGTPGSWSSFSTNPLRSSRTWLRYVLFVVWLIVWIRQILSDTLRVFTTRMPVPMLYALCFPLTFIGMFPLVKYLTYSVHPNFRVRLIENFDWLAPPFQTKHTKEEVGRWCEAAGLEILRRLPHGVVPKVGVLAKRR